MIRTLQEHRSGNKAAIEVMIDSWSVQLVAIDNALEKLRISNIGDFESSKMYLQSLLDNLSDSVTSFEMSQA